MTDTMWFGQLIAFAILFIPGFFLIAYIMNKIADMIEERKIKKEKECKQD